MLRTGGCRIVKGGDGIDDRVRHAPKFQQIGGDLVGARLEFFEQLRAKCGFGAAGAEIVVEEFLEGEEASFFVLSDGTHALPLAGAPA